MGLDAKNITFALEEDAETIATEWGLDQLKVQEMMLYMVELGLFENDHLGRVTCMKLANRLDDTNSKNPEIKRILSGLKGKDSEKLRQTPTNSEYLGPDKTRLDKTKDIKDLSSQPTADPLRANLVDIFEFWKSTMEKTGATKLDSKRKSKIEQRLKDGYTVEQIKQAIVNCSKTPHNMGHNDRGQKYNDIELICRDAANLERFIESKPETAGQQTQHDDTSWGQSMAQPYIPNQQKVLGNE